MKRTTGIFASFITIVVSTTAVVITTALLVNGKTLEAVGIGVGFSIVILIVKAGMIGSQYKKDK